MGWPPQKNIPQNKMLGSDAFYFRICIDFFKVLLDPHHISKLQILSQIHQILIWSWIHQIFSHHTDTILTISLYNGYFHGIMTHLDGTVQLCRGTGSHHTATFCGAYRAGHGGPMEADSSHQVTHCAKGGYGVAWGGEVTWKIIGE